MVLLLFGYGYVAGHLARLAAARGATCLATTRDGRAGSFSYADGRLDPALAAWLPRATHILISTPPHAGEAELASQIAARAVRCRWLGYLSSTGVYGDHHGGWVSETTPPAPMDTQAEVRLYAERLWRQRLPQMHCFRLAGIYGPGRSAFDRLRAGTAQCIDLPGHIGNRIHVADIARALWASMGAPTSGACYNLADDMPCPPADVVRYAAALLGVAPPPSMPPGHAHLSAGAARFYRASRQVSAAKFKRAYGISWQYPTYRHGLGAILQLATILQEAES